MAAAAAVSRPGGASRASASDPAVIAAAAKDYATANDVVFLFEELTRAVIIARPADPLPFLADEAARLKTLPTHEDKHRRGDPETEEEARTYLAHHRLLQLFEELMGSLLYHKPADPFDFLAGEFRRLQRGGHGARPTFFTDEDLRGMFSLFDPTGTGKISEAQARIGLRNLGLHGDPVEGASTVPAISEEEWVRRAKAAVASQRIV